jgi:hypothetical protein
LSDDPDPPPRLLLLAGEKGLPQASGCAETLAELRQRPSALEVLTVPASELIALDALSATWNLARSEDLETARPDGGKRTVTPEEVMESHRRCGRFAGSRVLQALLAAPALLPREPRLSLDEDSAVPVVGYQVEEVPIGVEAPPASGQEVGALYVAQEAAAALPVDEDDAADLLLTEDAAEALAVAESADEGAFLSDESELVPDAEPPPADAVAEAEQEALEYLLGEPEPTLAVDQEAIEADEEFEVVEEAVEVVEEAVEEVDEEAVEVEDENALLFEDEPPARGKK